MLSTIPPLSLNKTSVSFSALRVPGNSVSGTPGHSGIGTALGKRAKLALWSVPSQQTFVCSSVGRFLCMSTIVDLAHSLYLCVCLITADGFYLDFTDMFDA